MTPHRVQSIGEAMVKFKGHLKFLQDMPLKPVKLAIKIWCRCDSSNDYLCQMDVYVGKDETQPPARGRRRRRHVENQQQLPADRQEEGLVTCVVHLLTRKLVGKNYFVVMDNFFSSVELFKTLLEERIFCCGTLKENRKHFPRSLKGQVLKNQGDSKFARDREASFDTAVLVVVRKTSSAWGYNNISSRSLQPPFEILLLQ